MSWKDGVKRMSKRIKDMTDIEYLQHKLFAALKIPKEYLRDDEAGTIERQIELENYEPVSLGEEHDYFIPGKEQEEND